MAPRKKKPPLTDAGGNPTEAALAHGSSRDVAWAAEWAASEGQTPWIASLEAAFERLAAGSHKSDPGCLAKRALIEALDALEAPAGETFLTASRFVQMEPVWGESVDTAAGLRAAGAQALARMGHEEAGKAATDLLADFEANARLGGLRALEQWAGPGADLVLRLKALHCDPVPEVTCEVFAALTRLDAENYVPWVGQWLTDANEILAEGAALALGESRRPEAFLLLKAAWEREMDRARRSNLLTPIALLRSEEAFTFLLGIVRGAPAPHAAGAIDALAIYSGGRQRREQIEAAASARTEPEVAEAMRAAIPPRRR